MSKLDSELPVLAQPSLRAVPCQASLFVQDACSGSSILANARLWGVQILHVDGILLWRLLLISGF